MRLSGLVGAGGLLLSTTIGAGVFALPYVFYKSGWLLGLAYLLFFGLVMVITHSLYSRVLIKIHDREGLLGLTRDYLGKFGFGIGFLTILGGLTFAQAAFLVLASSFLRLIFPGVSFLTAVLIFWVLGFAPLVLGFKRFVRVELFGGAAMIGAVFLIFLSSFPLGSLSYVPMINFDNLFLPFGVTLFSLAAWTAIKPMIKLVSPREGAKRGIGWRELFLGTYAAVIVYAIFVLAVLWSAGEVTPDAVSGLLNWKSWRLIVLGVFGLFSLWTTYLPISFESKAMLERDLKQSKALSVGLVGFLPLFLVAAGLTNFLDAVILVGGVFLALQYFLLILVARKVLEMSFGMKVATFLMALIFLVGAVHEIYYFVVK